MRRKMVVFVGGTSHSGSTFLDLTLSNTSEGFSLGEVSGYFYPFRSFHFITRCACGDDNCAVWKKLTDGVTADTFHINALKVLPGVSYLVDSSKDPLWIAEATRQLRAAGIEVRHVLLWKTPWQFYQSCASRGRDQRWERAWINYHRLYFTLIDDWVSVRCADVVGEGTALGPLCDYLNIEYHQGLREYWNKTHHSLYGSHTARQHLYDADSDTYRESKGIAAHAKGLSKSPERAYREVGGLENDEKLWPDTARQKQTLKNLLYLLERRQLADAENAVPIDPAMVRRLQASKLWPIVKRVQLNGKVWYARCQHRFR